jgi:hypothetical protein
MVATMIAGGVAVWDLGINGVVSTAVAVSGYCDRDPQRRHRLYPSVPET